MASGSDDGFKITTPPPPAPSADTLLYVRNIGRDAALLGHPPNPPPQWAMFLKAWMEGWRAGADERNRLDGWTAINVDYEWKSR